MQEALSRGERFLAIDSCHDCGRTPGTCRVEGSRHFRPRTVQAPAFPQKKKSPEPVAVGDRGTEKKFWSTPDSPQLSAPVPCSQLHLVDRRCIGDHLFPGPFPASFLRICCHHLQEFHYLLILFRRRRVFPVFFPQLGDHLRRNPLHQDSVVHILLVCQLLHLHSALRWLQYTDCFQSCQTLPSALREP